uniref:Cysteine desulfurase n=1 Tax=Heterorhabditis bacteriophora TaxID=37862 RepID=A0A1I7XD46_HETBA
MLFSSASFHTSVSTYSNPFRKLSSIYRNSSPSTSPEPSPTTSWGLWLVSTLQGNLTTSDDRRRLVGDIARMSEEEQDNLIEFLQNGAAPCALENNACKQFLCNTSDLRTALTLNDPKREPINTEMTKVRSRTLPNKSSKRVTWLDMRKSATFSA